MYSATSESWFATAYPVSRSIFAQLFRHSKAPMHVAVQGRTVKCRPATDHRPVSSDADVLLVFFPMQHLNTHRGRQAQYAQCCRLPLPCWAAVRAPPPAVKCIVNFTLFSTRLVSWSRLLAVVGGWVDSVWVFHSWFSFFWIGPQCVCVRQTI